jgi:sugar lactone lactonase YvrE
VQLFSAGPDGLALDEAGNVVVTYGGPERKTLYITDSTKGNILAARMPIAGKSMYSHA